MQKAARELRGKVDIAVTSIKLTTNKVQTLKADIVAFKAGITSLKANHNVLNINILLVIKKYEEFTTKVNNVATNWPTVGAPITISTSMSNASMVKASEPPKFKGNKGLNITLKQWLQKMGLWFHIQDVTANDNRITLTLMYFKGGALNFISNYIDNASEGFALGSWSDFVDQLKTSYCQLTLKKTAQASLEEWCSKTYPSVIQFAENLLSFYIQVWLFQCQAHLSDWLPNLTWCLDSNDHGHHMSDQLRLHLSDLKQVPWLGTHHWDGHAWQQAPIVICFSLYPLQRP